jgi:biotin-dependent carboxylase-like uncharacterized protein
MYRISVLHPGLLTTIQDLGRIAYQQFGMPVSGAMDSYSLKLANLLVNNSIKEACLEFTLTGPHLFFNAPTYIAICGANMQATLNGHSIPMFETIAIRAGDELRFKSCHTGFRTYLAIAGGFDVQTIMNSKSTYQRAKIGGYNGRSLQQDDEIRYFKAPLNLSLKKAKNEQIMQYPNHATVRIIAGPEAHFFNTKNLSVFLNSEYKISSQSDRMGYRLIGAPLTHKSKTEIISSGIAFGTIQVPANGEPIIMMADRQTTGGYPRIANVVSIDLPLLAQLRPGSYMRFKEISLTDAHRLLKMEEIILQKIIK